VGREHIQPALAQAVGHSSLNVLIEIVPDRLSHRGVPGPLTPH
jgi:hypothetical protein